MPTSQRALWPGARDKEASITSIKSEGVGTSIKSEGVGTTWF